MFQLGFPSFPEKVWGEKNQLFVKMQLLIIESSIPFNNMNILLGVKELDNLKLPTLLLL